MVNDTYAKAYTEVLEIISYFSEEEYLKIPKEKIKFYEDNKDKNYEFRIDPNIDLRKQNISKEAYAIIILLFRDYFANEEQKEKLKIILKTNEKKIEDEKREKYNPDDVFKNRKPNINTTPIEKLPVEIKNNNFFTKLLNYITRVFNKKHNESR